jgi:hypothetical protein
MMRTVWTLPFVIAAILAVADHNSAQAFPVKPLSAAAPANIELARAVHGARGGMAARGPRGGMAARGPRGGIAVRGPHGRVAARGPRGAVAVRGHRAVAVRGPRGRVAVRGSRGAVAVRGPYRVGRRYYGGTWYGARRHYWHGRWWAYGVGRCWRLTPIGWVWICGL